MTKYMPFYLDNFNYLQNNKSFLIVGIKLGFLTTFLNSPLFRYCYASTFPDLQGGTVELGKIFMGNVYIMQVSKEIDTIFLKKLSELQIKYNKILENEINHMIYNLYGLTSEEIETIELAES